jgi:hypothetical protein
MGILRIGTLGMDILEMGILVGIGHIGWEIGKLDREKWGYWMGGYTERLGGLGLGRIRKLVCDGRETLFLAFLERFQYWNSCTANFLGHVTSRHMRDSTSRLDPFRLSRFRDRILIPRYCDPYF